ncbi:unnamed protein product [Periconia digitata]|uniref:Uncharacterized protein n=1 Tax=Periconia digitata TaxID=1303443 RepID=A0A9W4UJ38_9PLEO|nr:unnamed protein product [Periconia digitata]
MASFKILHQSSRQWRLVDNVEDVGRYLNNRNSPKKRYLLSEHDAFSEGETFPVELSQYFNTPSYIFSNVYRNSNGFFFFQEMVDDRGALKTLYTQSRFLVKQINRCSVSGYQWSEMTFFSYWTSEHSTILCMGVPSSFSGSLTSILSKLPENNIASSAYAAYVPLIETLVTMHDGSIWDFRDEIRSIEKARSPSDYNTSPFTAMHDTARHAIHSVETLSVSVKTLEAISAHISALSLADHQHHSYHQALQARRRVQTHIASQTLMLKNLLLRSQSNEKRLQNEISLSYNMIALRDSGIMTRISESAKLDSSDMRAIALVTMAFLPPTFISAVFSTSFFHYEPSNSNGVDDSTQWTVSGHFWVYWAFAIPLTLLTMGLWLFWERARNRVWNKGKELRGVWRN